MHAGMHAANSWVRDLPPPSAGCCINTLQTESALLVMRKRSASSARKVSVTCGAQLQSGVFTRMHAGMHAVNSGVPDPPPPYAGCCINTLQTESALLDMRKRSASSARKSPVTCGAQLRLEVHASMPLEV